MTHFRRNIPLSRLPDGRSKVGKTIWKISDIHSETHETIRGITDIRINGNNQIIKLFFIKHTLAQLEA